MQKTSKNHAKSVVFLHLFFFTIFVMMTHDQKRWANFIIQGKSPTDAAMLVFPNVSKKTAQNRASIFGKDPGIQSYIREQQELIEGKISDKLDEVAEKHVMMLLTAAKKREILAQIVSGQYIIKRTVIVGGKRKTIKEKPSINDIMKAIEIDNRMMGDLVQAKPNQVAKAEEVTKVVVVEDQTTPDK